MALLNLSYFPESVKGKNERRRVFGVDWAQKVSYTFFASVKLWIVNSVNIHREARI
jgi:hypothetical protein